MQVDAIRIRNMGLRFSPDKDKTPNHAEKPIGRHAQNQERIFTSLPASA